MRAIGGWNGVSSGIGPAFIVRLWLQLIALQHTSMPVRDQGTSRDDSATNAYAVNEGQEFSEGGRRRSEQHFIPLKALAICISRLERLGLQPRSARARLASPTSTGDRPAGAWGSVLD